MSKTEKKKRSKPKSNKMGRPKIEINEAQLRGLLRLKPTLDDVAAFFECSPDTIENECKRLGNCTFSEFRKQNMAHTRFNLIREAMRQATAGNTAMLIFCLKNVCGWKDRPDEISLVVKDKRELSELSDDELDELYDNAYDDNNN